MPVCRYGNLALLDQHDTDANQYVCPRLWLLGFLHLGREDDQGGHCPIA